ncbi:MAG: hypothetical protein M3Y77_04430 [Actinomycetota bacterium]|nr:hypothetical protein [Actinomycetota bacterium]
MIPPGPGWDDDSAADDADRVQGEVVDDAASAAFGGYPQPAADSNRPPSSGGTFGFPLGATSAGGMSVGGAFRMLTDASPEVRSMLAIPVRLLTIGVAVPSVVAVLFGIGIDGSPRYVAFAVALLGAISVVLLERRRRRLIAGPPAAEQRHGSVPAAPRRRGIAGLIGFSVLMMMLAIGFDVVALLLVIFGVW